MVTHTHTHTHTHTRTHTHVHTHTYHPCVHTPRVSLARLSERSRVLAFRHKTYFHTQIYFIRAHTYSHTPHACAYTMYIHIHPTQSHTPHASHTQIHDTHYMNIHLGSLDAEKAVPCWVEALLPDLTLLSLWPIRFDLIRRRGCLVAGGIWSRGREVKLVVDLTRNFRAGICHQ